MSNLPPTNPADEERIRAALHGYADTIETPDAWPTIVEKLDERRSPFAWLAQHPLALGAMAAVLVLVVVVSIGAITGDGDEENQDVDYVGPDQVDEEGTLIAITADGRLVELDASGEEIADYSGAADQGWADPASASDLVVTADGEFALLVQEQGGDAEVEACAGGLHSSLGLYPVHEVDPEFMVTLPFHLGAAPGLSPDGSTLSYVTAPDNEPCSAERVIVVDRGFGENREIGFADESVGIAVPTIVDVTQTLWLDDNRIVVVGHSNLETVSSLRSDALSVWIVDPSTDTELGTPLEIALPLATRLASAGAGEVFVAGHVDSAPFDRDAAGTYIGSDNTITIWRGSLDTLDAELIGVIDNSTQLPGGAPSTAAPMPGRDQAVLSLAGTPAGDALVTVMERPPTDTTTSLPTLYRVNGDVDPAVDPETNVSEIADGIRAAVSRGIGETAPEPVSDAGPVVGARPDGRVVRVDAVTGQPVEELALDADFPEAARIATDDTSANRALLGELAVAADGAIFQTRPAAPKDDCDATFNAAWDVYELSVEGSDVTGFFDDTDPSTGQPSRLPALSPDGKQLAYITTSSGERCDDALMIGVTDRASGDLLATHAMPVGVDVTGLTWTDDDALIVQHVAGNDGEFPSIIPVTLHQPLISGPVDFGASSVGYGAPGVLAASGDAEWPHLFGASFGGPLHVDLDDVYSDIAHEPPAAITLPWSKDQGSILSVARDRADTVWITVGIGEPAWPTSTWESYATYRWALPTTDQASTLAMVSEEFLAVAASPPEAAEPVVESDEPDVIDPSATVPGVSEPTDTTVPVSTVPTTVPTTTPTSDAEMLYLTWQGDLIRRTVGGDPEVVAKLPTPSDPAMGLVPQFAAQISVTSDGASAYVALRTATSTCRSSTMWKVDLITGALEDVGAGQVPAVSPDGTKLAYWRVTDNGDSGCDAVLTVRDLDSGTETSWSDEYVGEPGFAAGLPVVTRIAWGPDNRQLAFDRLYEDGRAVFLFDTQTAAGTSLTEESIVSISDIEDDTWALVGFDDVGVVARLECISDCPDDMPVRTFPAEGSAAPRADWTMSSLSNETVYGSQGFLSLRDCVSEGADCYGYPLWFEPLDGLDEEVESQYLVVAATWLP